MNSKIRIPHRYEWLWEPLLDDPGAVVRSMFGGKALYIDGRLCLHFAAKKEPWRGVLICTGRHHHESLQHEFPVLKPHSVLPKWLYLSEETDGFETIAGKLVLAARSRDERIGVEPKPKKSKAAKIKKRP